MWYAVLAVLLFFETSASAQTISICNRFSVTPDQLCTSSAQCLDFDPSDTGSAACETVPGATLLVCNRWSTNFNKVCSDDGQCPDASGSDGGQSKCGVPVRQTANYAWPVYGFNHPGPPGAQNFLYQDRVFKESVDTLMKQLDTNKEDALSFTTPLQRTDDTIACPTCARTDAVNTFTAIQEFPNAGLHLKDTDASHDLILQPGSNLTADRILTIVTGDSPRSLTLNGDATISGTNTGDQTITLTGHVTGSGTGSFATTLNAAAVEGSLEAVLDLQDIQGAVTDGQVPDTITVVNYLPLSGGAMTGELRLAPAGMEGTATDTTTDCSSFAATNGGIFYDDSEGKWKKCEEGNLTDLDTTGGTAAFSTLSGGTNTGAAMVVGSGASLATTGSGTIAATSVSANSVALGTDTTGNYAAGDAEAGAALTGDSATGFFSAGTLENARLDSDLTALGNNATNGLWARTGSGTGAARTILGTANEIGVAGGDGSSNPVLSLPATIDLGPKTSFEIPNDAAPTVDAFGELAGDSDLWATGRGAPIFFDGTDPTALVGVLALDAPIDGQVPKWHADGTITWENISFVHATDCRTNITTAVVGQTCREISTGLTWSCDAPEAGGASSLLCDDPGDWAPLTLVGITEEVDTLQTVFARGKQVIYSGTGEANGEVRCTDGNADSTCTTDGSTGDVGCVYFIDGALGPTVRCFPDAPIRLNAASGQDIIFRIGGVQGMALESDGDWAFSNFALQTIPLYWDAGGATTDGTGCETPLEETVNGGAAFWNFGCGDGGVFRWKVRLRQAYNAGSAFSFTIGLRTIGTSSVTLDGDVSAMCRGVGDVLDNTWGTPVQATVATGTTAHAIREATATGIVPNGTCAAGDWLIFRYIIDDANSNISAATGKIIGGQVGVVYNKLGGG